MFVITGNKIKLECKFDKSQNDGTIQVCPIIPVPLGIYVKKTGHIIFQYDVLPWDIG